MGSSQVLFLKYFSNLKSKIEKYNHDEYLVIGIKKTFWSTQALYIIRFYFSQSHSLNHLSSNLVLHFGIRGKFSALTQNEDKKFEYLRA